MFYANEDSGAFSFNPCFSGTRARTSVISVAVSIRSPVSILVFLELAPGPDNEVITYD